jgi:hypothetical protein
LAPACGLTITGTGTATSPSDAGPGDAIAPNDGSVPGEGGDGRTCSDGGTSLTLSFGSPDDLKSFVSRSNNNAGPSIELDAGVTLLRVTDPGAHDSLWFAYPVPLDAFDVSFETLVTCPTAGPYCGDGIAFVWLDAASIDAAYAGGVAGGNAFGIPSKIGGNAVALDLVRDLPQNDPDTPGLEIITLNSGLSAGTYRWVVSGANVPDLGRPMWNTIAISVRNGHAVVSSGGQKIEAGVAPLARGMFGFTAATGSDVAGFKVRNLRASFGCARAP